MPVREANRIMQVGAAWAIVHEAPSTDSKAIARLGAFDAVRVTAEAEFIRIQGSDGGCMLADMTEYSGESGVISPTWVRIEAGSIAGWIPARALANPVALATSSAAVAMARIMAVRGRAMMSLSDEDSHARAPSTPRRRRTRPRPDYDGAVQIAQRLAVPWIVPEGKDPFAPPESALMLPTSSLTLSDVDPAFARTVDDARSRARDLGLPERAPNGLPGAGLLSQLGIASSPEIQHALMVQSLVTSFLQEYPITVTEERMLGFEFLALSMAGRRALTDSHPITCYVRQVGSHVAGAGSMPYAAAGLDYIVLDDSDPDAMAMPGGPVLVTTGMLRLLGSEAELASVLAHEIAHIEERHALADARVRLLAKWIALRTAFDLLNNDDLGRVFEKSPCLRGLSQSEREAIRGQIGAMVKQMMLERQDELVGDIVRDAVHDIISGESPESEQVEMAADLRGLSLLHAAGFPIDAMEATLQRTRQGAPHYGGAKHAEARISAIRKAAQVLAPAAAALAGPGGGVGDPGARQPSATRWARLQDELARIKG